jgi:serine/threonine-protein kinase RsbW
MAEVSRVRREVDGFLRSVGAEPQVLYTVSLSLEELLTNIIEHGYRGLPDQEISVEVNRTEEGLHLVIEDEAPPFDPCSVPAPLSSSSVAEAEVGGHGLAMVRHLTAGLSYERDGEVNRLLVMIDG